MRNLKLVVFGGTGACGTPFVTEALKHGHHVRAVVRNMDKARRLFGEHESLDLRVGDPASAESVRDAIEGRDAVVTALASFQPPHNTMSTFTEHVISAAPAGLRFLTYSLAGVSKNGDRGSKTIQSMVTADRVGYTGKRVPDASVFSDCCHAGERLLGARAIVDRSTRR